MNWLARLFGMIPPETEEEELDNPSGSQSRLLPWKVVKNKKPSVWAITPRKLEDAVRAADRLIEGAAVFVNLQHIDSAKAQRIVDMLAGVSYALRGTFYEVGRRLFLFVPPNVPVGGDEETVKAISALFTGIGGATESEIELPVR
ncbi:MAG: cell division protein SepF [Armatimonadetes bacterium]|nr:cell division protein SepF [Armatimonadota bacterium]